MAIILIGIAFGLSYVMCCLRGFALCSFVAMVRFELAFWEGFQPLSALLGSGRDGVLELEFVSEFTG